MFSTAMPVEKSISLLPSTSSMMAPEARALTIGWIASSSSVPWAAWPAGLALILAAGWLHRTRLRDFDRAQAREAQLSLYRVGDTLARFDREEDLVHHALDAVAEGTGLRHWALYAHRGGRCAITGGYVVRGRYWYGDLCTGRVWSARFEDGRLGRPKRSRIVVPYLVYRAIVRAATEVADS